MRMKDSQDGRCTIERVCTIGMSEMFEMGGVIYYWSLVHVVISKMEIAILG